EQFDFFTSIDPWSRPVRVINAPDGTVWIVDMVRRVIEHPEWIPTAWQERLDLRSGSQLGRVYRVCYSDYQAEPMKALADNRQILQALASDNGARRDLALQALIQADEDSVATLEPTVRELANSHGQAAVRASALGGLLAKAWLTPDDVVATLASDDARLARLGLELAEHFADKLTPELQNAIHDVAARDLGLAVDLQWVLTATLLENFDAELGLGQIAARSSDDPWVLKAFSLLRQPKQALAVTEQLLDRWNADRPLSPEGFAEVEQCVSKLWSVCSVQDREALATERLQAMLDKTGSGFTNSQLLLLSSLAKDSPASEADAMGELLSRVTDRIIELMQADKLSEAEQLTFVNLLGSGLASGDDELKMATAFLQPDKSQQVRRTTIESLRRLREAEVGRMLLAQWPSLNSALRSSAGATLLSRREWAKALVEALEGGQVTASELDLPTLQHLSTYGDRELRNRCVELFGQPTERSQVVAKYMASLPSPAATPIGEKLFTEHCATCHKSVDGKPQIGPPLENLGHWTLDQWVSAILDPNKTLEPKYRQSTILTEDGEVISGLVLERNDRELLVGVSDGSVKTVPTASIADEKNAGISLMPVGFEQKLTPEQLSELLGFLRSR
ncbi:MAG: c-type cytochrome, partial [Planctomycetales bacterium]|nr:c-type cytochrome [Planctomycetales bacterium]